MNVTIDWMPGFANDPRIKIDGVRPELPKDQPYEKRGDLHRRDRGILVQYFYSNGKPTDGFGGATFEGKLLDGTPFKYKGAWSSRAACVNAEWPENPVVDVDWGPWATAIKVEALVDWWVQHSETAPFGLSVVSSNDDGPIVMATDKNGKLKGGTLRNHKVLCRLNHDNKAEFMGAFKK